jgi:hypothetical protein
VGNCIVLSACASTYTWCMWYWGSHILLVYRCKNRNMTVHFIWDLVGTRKININFRHRAEILFYNFWCHIFAWRAPRATDAWLATIFFVRAFPQGIWVCVSVQSHTQNTQSSAIIIILSALLYSRCNKNVLHCDNSYCVYPFCVTDWTNEPPVMYRKTLKSFESCQIYLFLHEHGISLGLRIPKFIFWINNTHWVCLKSNL